MASTGSSGTSRRAQRRRTTEGDATAALMWRPAGDKHHHPLCGLGPRLLPLAALKSKFKEFTWYCIGGRQISDQTDVRFEIDGDEQLPQSWSTQGYAERRLGCRAATYTIVSIC